MNKVVVMERELVKPELQMLVDEVGTNLPVTLAHVLTPLELGKVWVIHPTDNDPVLVSEHYGAVAIWFNF